MVRKITILLCLFGSFLVPASSAAQAVAGQSPTLYVVVGDMNGEEFMKLHNTLKADGRFEIKYACQEANILSVVVLQGQDMDKAYADFKTLAISAKAMRVEQLADFNDEKFLERCKSARTGQ
jgi:hypothetical protein